MYVQLSLPLTTITLNITHDCYYALQYRKDIKYHILEIINCSYIYTTYNSYLKVNSYN